LDELPRHPNDNDLYTPLTTELLELLVKMRNELGSWREVAAAAGVRTRVLRRLHRVEVRCVSLQLMDRLCQGTGIGHISEFVWFEANDLVALGFWKEPEYLDGRRVRYEAESTGQPRIRKRPKRYTVSDPRDEI